MPRITKKTKVQAQIDRMVKRIVKKFHPEMVILFGSQARGDAGPDSDVDLLIVLPFEGATSSAPITSASLTLSKIGHHVAPALVVFQTPPAGMPM